VHLPTDIADIVQGVLGLDDRPQAKAHFQKRNRTGVRALTPDTSFIPTQLASLYSFPPDADGSGQCIALIELGGGYQTRDLNAYFDKLKCSPPYDQRSLGRRRS
jgi:kumamolisin